MGYSFPRTEVAGVSLSRMIIGTNWLAGWSHTGPAADQMIKSRHSTPHTIEPMFKAYLDNGIDTIMGVISSPASEQIYKAIQIVQEKYGKKLNIIDTPIINVDDNAQARREAEADIKRCKEMGATFCFLHHSSVEQLVDKNQKKIHRLDDYTKMIRDAGMIPGLSAHMPEIIVYSDLNEYDVQTYIQIYNCMGFMMQVEIESVNKIIWEAKKPVMTIKSMAAGRCSPFVGITFSFSTLRPCDMVTVGAMTADEVHEDVEIGMAAIERRRPDLEGRNSPNKTDIIK